MTTLVVLIAASLCGAIDVRQHAAVTDVLAAAGCGNDTCPSFSPTDPCPPPLTCVGDDVTVINLQSLNLTGSLHSAVGALSALLELFVGNNSFRAGTLPPSLSRLTALKTLSVFSSNFVGDIAPIAALTRLERIFVNNNRFNGSWSAIWEPLKPNLTDLLCGSNAFTGTVPETIKALTGLTRLDAAENQLNGTLPQLSALTALREISFRANKLSSFFATQVPDTINTCDFRLNCLVCAFNRPAACLCTGRTGCPRPPTPTPTNSTGLSGGAIVGAAVGGAVAFVVIVSVIVILFTFMRKRNHAHAGESAPEPS